MPRAIPPLPNLALIFVREAHGLSQKALAEANHVTRSTISEMESGVRELTPERLEELLAPLGIGADVTEDGLAAATLLHPSPPAPATPVDPTAEERRIIERATARVERQVGADFKSRLIAEVRRRRAAADREEAEALWRRLKPYRASDRRLLVEQDSELQTWALAERLCVESEDAAPGSAVEALELAELARLVARLALVPESWRPCLEGYTIGLVANAHRAGGRLNPADAAYAEALALVAQGDPGEPALLDMSRLLDLGASLRRDQRRFDEALVLHERAMTVAPPERAAHNLLKLSATLEQKGDYPGSIAALEEAAPLVDGARQPRLLCVLRFNLAANRLHLQQPEEAERLLPGIRALTRALNKESDGIRLRWLEGEVAAGLGRRQEAIPALEQVRQWFAAKDNPYDMALATLELATLYLEEGQTAKVKELVLGMAPIFKEQKVHREALAALTLFRDAALQETATAALARRLVRYLAEARHDQERRFEG